MRKFRTPLLGLLLYVSLDFANPLIPGAVSFDPNDTTEGVRLERPRGAVAPGEALPRPLSPGIVPEPAPRLAVRRVPAVTAPLNWLVHITPAQAQPGDPGTSPEDH